MKNKINTKTILVLVSLVLSFLIINSLNFVSTADSLSSLNSQVETLNDNLTAAQRQLDSLPKDADEIRNRYLNQEWNKIIDKNKVLGPIHRFFIAHPKVFVVIFNQEYSFSQLFFATVLAWFLITMGMAAFYYKAIKNEIIDWLLGAVTASIIAVTGILKPIVEFILKIIFSQEYWWMRALVWLTLFLLYLISIGLIRELKKNFKAQELKKEKSEMKQKIEQSEAYIEGQKEAAELTKSKKTKT